MVKGVEEQFLFRSWKHLVVQMIRYKRYQVRSLICMMWKWILYVGRERRENIDRKKDNISEQTLQLFFFQHKTEFRSFTRVLVFFISPSQFSLKRLQGTSCFMIMLFISSGECSNMRSTIWAEGVFELLLLNCDLSKWKMKKIFMIQFKALAFTEATAATSSLSLLLKVH